MPFLGRHTVGREDAKMRIIRRDHPFPLQCLAYLTVHDNSGRVVEDKYVCAAACLRSQASPFRDQHLGECFRALAAYHLIQACDRRGVVSRARQRDTSPHGLRLLTHRLGKLSGGHAHFLEQPERLSLLDRSRLLVIAHEQKPRTSCAADL
jgi:hypothetical protein